MAQGRPGEFDQSGGVAGQPVIPFEFRLLVRPQIGGGDFADLMAEQIELLRVGFFVHDQGSLFGFERPAAAGKGGKVLTQRIEAAEGIENGELPGGVQQRLMVVRAVNVHEPLAERAEHVQRGG